jgi:Flp pilus assembly protein TadG
MPFLVVLAVGLVDFGQAWNLKQKLSNAAREGARFGASQSTVDLGQANPQSVTAIGNVVASYLASASVTQCTNPASWTETQSGLQWTYASSDAGCSGFSLVIDRSYNFLPAGGSTTLVATHVTLSYPYTWTFNHVIGLLVKGASPALPSTISSDAVMQNLP